ncbi:MAG: kinase [Xanthomonadales bacterium]|nr:kinase [Xanthomonadales bacterium]NNL94144.1 kinase [Xanthomonadales bacterium]
MPRYSIAADKDSLPEQASRELERTVSQLLETLPARRPLTIGLGGAPGTGKTTLARACAARIDATMVLSLDDYYLPRAQRMSLADAVHPLLANRGVAGTHDIELLASHLAQLKNPGHEEIEIPLFDKQQDERRNRGRFVMKNHVPELVFLEGWIVGVPPQAESDLVAPVNAMEIQSDPHATWRTWVNRALGQYSELLTPLLDLNWQLVAPDWETIIEWRWAQECQLERPWLKSRDEVAAFLAPFQRWCIHAQQNCRSWADHVITLDHRHGPVERIDP